ncbi:MAG: acetate/propionate family kinase [Pseudomonadota bacterium]
MTGTILVLNVGSSSIKFASYPADTDAAPILAGSITGIGRSPKLTIRGSIAGDAIGPLAESDTTPDLIARLVGWLESEGGDTLVAAGHRVVHGGRDFSVPVIVNDGIMARLDQFESLAPNHQPHNLAGIRAVAAARPNLPQVACFDTAFHRTQPQLAQLYAIPRALTDAGVLHYGFHGLSYDYIASVLPSIAGDRADGKVIVAHLGHGASLCAMRHRKSVATTMGFTALDGLVMGKRPGRIDPGVVLHLLQDRGMEIDAVTDLLNGQSGLLGVSGISDDMRDLLASDDARAREAVDLFIYRLVEEVGALTALLGGLDLLVFTAGIGENASEIRAGVSAKLSWLGLKLDPAANRSGQTLISTPESAIGVLVIPTDEEGVIARSTRQLVG